MRRTYLLAQPFAQSSFLGALRAPRSSLTRLSMTMAAPTIASSSNSTTTALQPWIFRAGLSATRIT